MAFENKGPSVEFARLGFAVSELIIDQLAAYSELAIFERAGAKQLLAEGALVSGGLATRAEDQGKLEGIAADFLLTGSFQREGSSLSLDMSLLKVESQETLVRWDVAGPIEAVGEMARQLSTQIAELFKLEKAAPPGLTDSTRPSPLVVVLTLKNLSPVARLDPMEFGFAEILQANLSAIDGLRLVERQRLHAMLSEQKLTLSGLADPETAVRVGRLLGAQRLIHGSFLELGERLYLQARVVDVETTSVLASASVEGEAAQFDPLIFDLTAKLGGALAELPADMSDRLRRRQPVHGLEAALHYTRAQGYQRRGRLAEAAAACEQALLLEPQNLHLHRGRCEALFQSGAYKETITAVQQALGQPFPAEARETERATFYNWLLHSYWYSHDYVRQAQAARQALQEFSDPRTLRVIRYHLAIALIAQAKRDEGTELLEATLAEGGDQRDESWYQDGLFHLFQLYWKESNQTLVPQQDPQASRKASQRAQELYDEILEVAAGRRDEQTRTLGRNVLRLGTQIGWDQSWRGPEEDQAQDLKNLQKGLEVLGWIPEVAAGGYFQLAELLEQNQQWPEALEAHRQFQRVEYEENDGLPPLLDWMPGQPNTWLDKRIESFYRTGRILEMGLRHPQEAIEAYQRAVREFGVTTFRGPDIVAALQRVGEKPVYPAKAALVWGGATDVRNAYAHFMDDLGYQLHSVRLQPVTLAHLLPYRLVILARSGHRTYSPGEILALRSYVACGGSLLVLLSPGWEPASPSLHNSLLSFFGASVNDDFAVRAESTNVEPHPITQGIDRVMAKNTVGIEVVPQQQLIRCGDRTVLAATHYRQGRVVLAAFGQWLLPDPTVLPEDWQRQRYGNHWSRRVPTADLPIESGRQLHQELLRNVLQWLAADVERTAEYSACRQILGEAAHVTLAVQAQAIPWEEMESAVSSLEEVTAGDTWPEELLWAAGEFYQQMRYDAVNSYCIAPSYGDSETYPANPRYYRELIEQFPDSSLRPWSQWRLGECERRAQLAATIKQSGGQLLYPQVYEADPMAALAAFQRVDAPEGSYAWAWTQLRLGMLRFRMDLYQEALSHFQAVSERMSVGPEKVMALLSLAACEVKLRRWDEATRYFELAQSLPSILCDIGDIYSDWGPLGPDGHRITIGDTRDVASQYLAALARRK
ncbi:MAG: CsgG/HfaB family protein [Pirellulaceae bacterium]